MYKYSQGNLINFIYNINIQIINTVKSTTQKIYH